MLSKAIEAAKEIMTKPDWPRSVKTFSGETNCWGYALDGVKIPCIENLTYHSFNKNLKNDIVEFLNQCDCKAHLISSIEEKKDEEIVIVIFSYDYFDMRKEELFSEVHIARIDKTGFSEKAGWKEKPVYTSLTEVIKRINSEDHPNKIDISLVAFRKPC